MKLKHKLTSDISMYNFDPFVKCYFLFLYLFVVFRFDSFVSMFWCLLRNIDSNRKFKIISLKSNRKIEFNTNEIWYPHTVNIFTFKAYKIVKSLYSILFHFQKIHESLTQYFLIPNPGQKSILVFNIFCSINFKWIR